MTSRQTAQQLRRLFELLRHLRTGEPLAPDDAAALVDALRSYLTGTVSSLDDAFGLTLAPGENDWRTSATLARRNQLLCTSARRFWPDLPMADQAESLHKALLRYRASGWVHDRIDDECPRRPGSIEEACWHILTVYDRLLSAHAIRKILARG